jgi:hypothetical protein
MLTQTQRKTLLHVAEDILEAALSERDSFDFLLSAYRLSNQEFAGRANDPDPTTILLGLQAMALGIVSLTNWLEACSLYTSLKYHNQAQEIKEWLSTTLDHYGIVLPPASPL